MTDAELALGWRRQLGLTQEDAAAVAGVGRIQWWRYENSESRVPWKVWRKLLERWAGDGIPEISNSN